MPAPTTPAARATRAGRPGRARDRRRERRAGTGATTPPYIVRRVPPQDLLDDEALTRIETAAATLLAEIGIDFRGGDTRSLELWRDAGAEVRGDNVRFPPGLLDEVLAGAPAEFEQIARNPARSVRIGGDAVVFAPAYGSPFVMDLDRGRRYGTLEDFQNFVKLAYMQPWLHHSGGTVCEPTDVPVSKRHLDMVYAHLRYSDRPFMGSVTAEERAEDSIEMARIAFGAETLERHCAIIANFNVNSPLVWDATMTRGIRAYARANQGSVIVPFILGGAMGPVTLAGAIAQAHAETLVGCALAQLERRGAPVVYGNFLSSMSLRSGSPTFGTPEPAVGSLVVGQLARRARLPLRCSGAFTTAKLPDAQSMMESVTSMQAAVASGAHFVLHAAGFLDGLLSMSYEKFVLDADYCGALHRYLAGVTVNDDELALDAFREVGPGNHFFGCAHTMAHYESAFFDAALSDNTTFEQWSEAGAEDSAVRANRAWKQMLADYQAPAIEPGLDEALRGFVERRKRELPDAWH